MVREVAAAPPIPPRTGHDAARGGNLAAIVANPVLRVVARRCVLAVPLLFVVSALTFILVSLTPGNAAEEILGTSATPDQYAALDSALGLNLPLYDQYWTWLRHALTGDLGQSVFTGQPVAQAIGQRLPVTLSLLVGALLVSLVIGVGLGVLSALRCVVTGRAVDVLALIGFSLPAFWVGAELIVVFAVWRDWFPATGYVSFSDSPAEWLRSLVLPVVALSLYGIAATAKQTREAMLDVLGSEYIRMARANGISGRAIVVRHALRNASVRVVTVLGLQAVGLLGGTVLVENVFALPGLGSLMVNAATQHDLPVVAGMVVYFTLIVVVINLLVDLAYVWLNPRVRVR
jgi:peptide/nickel transport system permease protein